MNRNIEFIRLYIFEDEIKAIWNGTNESVEIDINKSDKVTDIVTKIQEAKSETLKEKEKLEEEIKEKEQEKEKLENDKKQLENDKKELIDIVTSDESDEDKVSKATKFFEYWGKDTLYEKGQVVKYEETVYKILKDHKSESTPDKDETNYKPLRGEYGIF